MCLICESFEGTKEEDCSHSIKAQCTWDLESFLGTLGNCSCAFLQIVFYFRAMPLKSMIMIITSAIVNIIDFS